MHPDQHTPGDHRTQAPESADQAVPAHLPAQDQHLSGSADDLEIRNETVSTPQTDGARTGEAGSQYVGREMDDRLKSSPRADDRRDVERPE